ncbi:MAG TPA: heme-binding domain-containing protein [Blastocatellia bacterium]|nr:heme-binding domain-containing protein [Blastocatellia bacterium]
MKKVLKWTGISLIVVLVVIQAIRPAKTNPEVDEARTVQAHTSISPEVSAILERSCYDCHSSKTTWPWYSQVAPVSWLLVRDVNQGRRELSFSDWARLDARRAARKLQEICEQVEKGEMPMSSYVLLHPDAKLSDSDKQLLCDWAKRERDRVLAAQPANPQ